MDGQNTYACRTCVLIFRGFFFFFMLTYDVLAALPAVLAHSNLINIAAMIMSIVGGLLIYGTIVSFGMFFQEEQEF